MGIEYLRPSLISLQNSISKKVLLLDDCEGTTLFVASGTGDDFSAANHADARYHGSKGLKLLTKETTPAENDYISAFRYVCLPRSGIYSASFRFSLPDASDVKYLQFGFYTDKGGYLYYPSLTIYPNTKKFYFTNSAGSDEDVCTTTYSCTDNTFHTIELQINISTAKYVAAFFDHYASSFSEEALPITNTANVLSSYIFFKLVAAGANQAAAYIDDIQICELSLS